VARPPRTVATIPRAPLCVGRRLASASQADGIIPLKWLLRLGSEAGNSLLVHRHSPYELSTQMGRITFPERANRALVGICMAIPIR
jgi:hypothetical protein